VTSPRARAEALNAVAEDLAGELMLRPLLERILLRCTEPLFELGDDEMEIGVGVHGEPGRRREKLADANAIIDELLEAVVTDLPYQRGDNVALMINGLGGTPISELYLLYGRAHDQLAGRGITVGRSYVGEYCTSLDMAGASVTLVKLDDEITNLLAAPAEVANRIF
jgi:dihydroxyacetone kinase-like protein